MPVPYTIVQIAGGTAVTSVNCPGTLTFTQAFTNANVAGNTLLVILGCDTGNITSTTINTFGDTLTNAYTQIFNIDHGTNTGPALAAYWFPNCAAGANTVSIEYNCACIPPTLTANFYPFMIVAEISGLTTTPTLQDQGSQQNFSGTTSSIAITNSVSTTVTLDVACANTYNAWAIIDLLASGVDNYFVCGMAVNNAGTDTSSITPTTVGVPRLAASVPNPLDVNPSQSTYLALYTMGPGVLPIAGEQRGNIDADQVGLDARQGPLYGKQIVYSDGTFTQGGIPAFLIDGTLTNSGNNAGAGAGSGTVTSVTASGPLVSSGGANPDISLTTPLSVADGGTGTASPGLVAGTAISITGTWPNQTVASSGSGVSSVTASSPLASSGGGTPNITIASPIPVADGGTGTATPGLVAGTAISVTGSWPNQTITNTGSGVSSVTASSPLASSGGATPNISITSPLPVANGGTGTTTPGLVAGTNIAITGTWPDQTVTNSGGTVTSVTASSPLASSGGATPVISISTPIPVADGGTGTATPGLVAGTAITITGSWPNQTVTNAGVTSVTATSPLASSGGTTPAISISTPIPLSNGGTGTATPTLTAGTGVSITGTWPNQTITSTGSGVTASGAPWSGLSNPSANLSLGMGADTSTFTYNAATGSADLFTFTDGTNNSGTGSFIAITKASGSNLTGIHLKQLRNADTQPLILLENNTGATMGLSIGDVGGQATAHIDTGSAQFLIQRSTALLLNFNGTGGKCLTTMTCNFDGTVSTEIGITLTNSQSASTSSTAAIVSVQNNGTRLFDVAPAITTVKSGQFAIATSHTPSSSTATGTAGTIAWDGSYLYVCVATNSWVRLSAAMVTF